VSRRRIVTIAVGVALLVLARVLDPVIGGYPTAVVVGVGLGVVVVGLGRREPHLPRRHDDTDPDHADKDGADDGDDGDDGHGVGGARWSQW
jgi:hypothetical protein